MNKPFPTTNHGDQRIGRGLLTLVAGLMLGLAINANATDTPAVTALHGGDAAIPSAGLFAVYQANRDQGLPNYITTDLMLLGYAMVRRAAIADFERDQAIPAFSALIDALRAALNGAGNDQVSAANRDYLDLLAALMHGKSALAAGERAQRELDLILAATGPAQSPLWGRVMDYSQFRPRGRYAASPALRQYFRAMRYAGSALFAVTPTRATGVTQALARRMAAQALQLAQVITADPELCTTVDALDQALRWQFGPAEDLTLDDLLALADSPPDALAPALLARARQQHRQPRIIADVVDASRLEPGLSAADALTGWRLLPLRFTAGSAALQALVWPATGAYLAAAVDTNTQLQPFGLGIIGGQPVKAYPSARELMVALGSRAARDWQQGHGEQHFDGYDAAFASADTLLGDADGLDGLHIALLRALFDQDAKSAPASDANPARGKRLAEQRLTTALALWTWRRYLDVLYTKQSYTLAGKGLQLPVQRAGATIEPAPAVYQALAALVAAHRRQTPAAPWDRYAALLDQVLPIARQVADGGELDAEQQALLNTLDRHLLDLTGGPDQPIVIDIHSSPATGQVVEEGTGYARVVVAAGGSEARGARFSHYEFKQPIAQRLTDDEWRAMLADGRAAAIDEAREPVSVETAQ